MIKHFSLSQNKKGEIGLCLRPKMCYIGGQGNFKMMSMSLKKAWSGDDKVTSAYRYCNIMYMFFYFDIF